MHKDQKEELERLEEALLKMDPPVPEEDEEQWLEEFYGSTPDGYEEDYTESYSAYNADDTDVDLDDYSEDVHAGRQSGGCLVPIVLFLTLVLCALVGFVLWKQGVLG